jgi:hypothetical protein
MRRVGTPCASLRVYEPLEVLVDDDRRAAERLWAQVDRSEAGLAAARREALSAEATITLATALRSTTQGSVLEREPDPGALLMLRERTVFACPLAVRLRWLLACEAARTSMAPEVFDAFLPPRAAELAETELALERHRRARLDPHVRQEAWHVPMHWFGTVVSNERQLTMGRGGRPEVRYVTTLSQARRRTARALVVLRRLGEDGFAVAAVDDLERWLSGFDAHSWLELDYGPVAALLDEDALLGDTSPQDAAEALAALAAGRTVEAVAAYRRLVERWEPVRALGTAN